MRRKHSDLLASAQEVLQGLGITRGGGDGGARRGPAGKADVIASNNPEWGGDLMTQRQAHRLVDLTISESSALSLITNVKKAQRAGSIPMVDFSKPVVQKAIEATPGTGTGTPETSGIAYNCKKVQATLFISLESLREARATGEPDFEQKVRRGFARAMSNDVARLFWQGDTSIAPVDADGRLLCVVDGFLKRARNGRAIRSTTALGEVFDTDLPFALKRRLPRRYRNSPANRWMLEGLVDLAWRKNRADAGDTSGIVTGDRALTQVGTIPMLGEESLRIPQIPTDQGFATLSGSTAPADLVSTSGDGIAFRVDTLFGGASAANKGRVVKITHIESGETEDVIVQYTSSHNVATTAGTLGQASVSTTAADYAIDIADCTSLLYGNPANLFAVWCDEIRSYSKVEQESERLRVDIFMELDCGIFVPQALAMQDGLAIPASSSKWG